MKKPKANPNPLRSFLHAERVATLEELKAALGTTGTMTVFRRLKVRGYMTSYSHRGKYYTLPEIPEFNEQGLWSHHSVWFSRYGNLVETVREFIKDATAGWTAQELERILQVEVKRSLLRLYQDKIIHREKISGVYTYFSDDCMPVWKRRRWAMAGIAKLLSCWAWMCIPWQKAAASSLAGASNGGALARKVVAARLLKKNTGGHRKDQEPDGTRDGRRSHDRSEMDAQDHAEDRG